jgi:hypothetical protein
MDNYLSAEQAIISRLKTTFPDFSQRVFAAVDLAGVTEAAQVTPAIHVLYNGDKVVDGGGRSSTGEVQCIDQMWYVVLAVRNVRNQISGQATREEVGVLAGKVLKCLQGWSPTKDHGPLKRTTGVPPGYNDGYFYMPFCFATRVTI